MSPPPPAEPAAGPGVPQGPGARLPGLLRRASLSRLLFAAFMVMWAVTAVPIFYVTFVYTEDAAFARAEGDVTQRVELLASSFEGEYRTATARSLKQVSSSSVLQDLLSGSSENRLLGARELEAHFFSVVREHAAYQSIWFIDMSGREVAAVVDRERGDTDQLARNWAGGTDAASPELVAGRKLFASISTTPALLTAGNMEWFMPPRDIVYEGPFRDSRDHWAMLAGMPILDPDSGAFSGTVVIQLSLAPFVEVLSSVKGFGSRYAWLTSARDGAPLLKPAAGEAAGASPAKASPLAPAQTRVVRTGSDLLAYRDLMTSDQHALARLAYVIPASEIAKDFAGTRNLLLLVLVISAVVALALAQPTARAIATPINRLAEASERLSRGELEGEVRVQAGGEVRTLVDSFNAMARNLRDAELSRTAAMDVLRSTVALLGDLPRGDVAAPAGQPQDDERDLRRIADLIRELIREREQRLEDLRAAKLEAEAANQAKGDFLATMGHEIRTPLNAVVGLAELLAGSNLAEDQSQMARVMQSAGNHLLTVVNDVLDFTKLQSGRFEINEEPLDLPPLLDAVMMMTRALAGASALDIRAHMAEDLPRQVKADGARITQILANLLGNAVKFTAEGSVTLDVRAEADAAGARWLDFVVSDTGPGIAPKDRDRIFQPFTQVGAGRLTPKPGTGLGLTISRGLAEAMGGSLRFEEPQGRGAVFRLRVPLKVAQPRSPVAHGNESASRTGPLRILVAEDTPANQLVIRLLLARLGHEPTIVDNGRLALEAFQGQPFDIVILDLQMPEMNGYEAAKAIRAAEAPGRHVPILALSAFTQDADKEMAIAHGFDAFLSKPISLAGLSRGIGELTGREHPPAA